MDESRSTPPFHGGRLPTRFSVSVSVPAPLRLRHRTATTRGRPSIRRPPSAASEMPESNARSPICRGGRSFQDPVLKELIEEALDNNYDLRIDRRRGSSRHATRSA